MILRIHVMRGRPFSSRYIYIYIYIVMILFSLGTVFYFFILLFYFFIDISTTSATFYTLPLTPLVEPVIPRIAPSYCIHVYIFIYFLSRPESATSHVYLRHERYTRSRTARASFEGGGGGPKARV